MPTYEYECKSCSHSFEVFQSMNDPPLKICPECGSEVRRLIFGGTGVIFKGSGFYVTDKGKSGKTAGKPCPANGSSSQKPDSAPCACCPNAAGQASKQASQDSSGPAAGSSSEKPGRQSKSA
jgi:putative FmdB family regulatory protein